MRVKAVFYKVLAFSVIVALLSMRLYFLSDEFFVVPVENAIFGVAFIADNDSPTSGSTLKAKHKSCSDIVLIPAEQICYFIPQITVKLISPVTELILRDITAEIFIPPETLS